MKNIIKILAFSLLVIVISNCSPKQEFAGKEVELLGKWKNPTFVFEFQKNGKMKIIEADKQLQLDYFLTNENNNLYLHILSMGDTNKLYIDSLSDTFLRMAPVKNLRDIKEFSKQK